MIPIDFSWFALLYTGTGIVLILGLWIFYERRDQRIYQAARERVTFHCIKCGELFTASSSKEVSPCPKCGFENARLKF